MTIEEIQRICKKYPGVTEDIKWNDSLCFSVGGKMFLITSPDVVPCIASIKVTDETFQEITIKNGFSPAPYLARYNWIRIEDISLLTTEQWEVWIDTAYRLVASRLTLKLKKEIGLK